MATRLIGSGTTDSQGKININYTGTGAGKLQLIAKQGNLLSETYELIDATFADIATTGNKNTNWNNPSTAIEVTTDGTGTTLSNSSGTYHYWANNYTKFTSSFAVEFDLLSYTDNTNASFRFNGSNSHSIVYKTIGCPQQCHLKIMYTGTKIQYQIDNEAVTDFVTPTDTEFYIGFRFAGESSVKYKNFAVYPI